MSSVFKKIIYSVVLVEACGIVNCSMRTLSLGIQNLVYWPGIESSSSALGAWSLSLWTTGEIPNQSFFRKFFPGSPPGYLLKHLEKFCFGLSFWRPWIMSLISKISLLMSWIYLVIYLFGLINPQGLNFSGYNIDLLWSLLIFSWSLSNESSWGNHSDSAPDYRSHWKEFMCPNQRSGVWPGHNYCNYC